MTSRRSLFEEEDLAEKVSIAHRAHADSMACSELLDKMAVVVRMRSHGGPDRWEALAVGPVVQYGHGKTPVEAMRAALALQPEIQKTSRRRIVL